LGNERFTAVPAKGTQKQFQKNSRFDVRFHVWLWLSDSNRQRKLPNSVNRIESIVYGSEDDEGPKEDRTAKQNDSGNRVFLEQASATSNQATKVSPAAKEMRVLAGEPQQPQ
jgi:hypothetical protein